MWIYQDEIFTKQFKLAYIRKYYARICRKATWTISLHAMQRGNLIGNNNAFFLLLSDNQNNKKLKSQVCASLMYHRTEY